MENCLMNKIRPTPSRLVKNNYRFEKNYKSEDMNILEDKCEHNLGPGLINYSI